MKKRIRKILIGILALVFLGSLVMLLRQQQTYRAGEEIYLQAEQLAEVQNIAQALGGSTPSQTPPEADGEEEQTADLEALQAVSEAVIGWIRIPETKLSYPLVQGADNDYYLNHAWNGQSTSVGSIFLDYRCAPDLMDVHTIIYGHRMKDGSMFAALKYYNKLAWWEEHPWVYVETGEGTRRYEIFAAYEAPVRSCTYELEFPDDAARQELIDFALEQSVIQTGVIPQSADRILTLSTCTGKGYETRWVVQAVERPMEN